MGTIGAPSRRFVEFLAQARQTLWNILPLNPTGADGCPYHAYSAFAGNPTLVDLHGLAPYCGAPVDVPAYDGDPRRVPYGAAIAASNGALTAAFELFEAHRRGDPSFEMFCADNASWLDDYALFCALADYFGTPGWLTWPPEFRTRDPGALHAFATEHADRVLRHKFVQWVFFAQWHETRRAANDRGIAVIGDVPIFVSLDSADVWASQHLFLLEGGRPLFVAGVPPDYFSPTGQLWGNPLYDWDAIARDGFEWWRRRFEVAFRLYDIVRIDHFRGFEAYWAIPAGSPDAVKGRWVKAPGDAFFGAMRAHFGGLPVIAEDLGIITDEVTALRRRFDLPGMKVLQFAFGEKDDHPFLPHNFRSDNCIVFTGTHDNDTTVGWFRTIPDWERRAALSYLGVEETAEISWEMARLALSSRAKYAVVPFQDLIAAGSEARYNTPGTVSDTNWSWRALDGDFLPETAYRLAGLTEKHGRAPRRR